MLTDRKLIVERYLAGSFCIRNSVVIVPPLLVVMTLCRSVMSDPSCGKSQFLKFVCGDVEGYLM